MIANGDHEGALIEAERALVLTPNLASAHGVLGDALAYSGHRTKGLAALNRSIALNTGLPPPRPFNHRPANA